MPEKERRDRVKELEHGLSEAMKIWRELIDVCPPGMTKALLDRYFQLLMATFPGAWMDRPKPMVKLDTMFKAHLPALMDEVPIETALRDSRSLLADMAELSARRGPEGEEIDWCGDDEELDHGLELMRSELETWLDLLDVAPSTARQPMIIAYTNTLLLRFASEHGAGAEPSMRLLQLNAVHTAALEQAIAINEAMEWSRRVLKGPRDDLSSGFTEQFGPFFSRYFSARA